MVLDTSGSSKQNFHSLNISKYLRIFSFHPALRGPLHLSSIIQMDSRNLSSLHWTSLLEIAENWMDFAERFAVIRIRKISPLHFLRHYLEWKISKDIQYIRFYNDRFIIHLYVYNFTAQQAFTNCFNTDSHVVSHQKYNIITTYVIWLRNSRISKNHSLKLIFFPFFRVFYFF